MARLPVPGSDDGTWGGVLNAYLRAEHNADGTHPDSIKMPDWSVIAGKPSFGAAAMMSVGTSSGTVAAGDDARLIVDNVFITLSGAAAAVALTSTQAASRNVYLRGVLSQDTVIEVPNVNRTWNVIDETTGSGVISIRHAGGSSKVLPRSTAQAFYATGS